ncbi:plant invertase/pectin methylesterase inhibitor protein [Trifolium pratense]|uniref:Plant invertase/pectin methylesterase inhibitor protein n=1 Tax=Trifolium pratense TaxID=57577 RepID=A0A2K3LL52_TRIPR|nr:plant invertase/pectin methylesterase inhibitor protein [Trifolium pratense]
MKSTRLSSSSLFIICLCLICHAAVPILSLKLYEIVCHETSKDLDFCLRFLGGDYKIVGATNYHDLSKYILDLTTYEAKSVQEYFTSVSQKLPSNAIRKCINDFYNKAIDTLSRAMDELNNPQYAKDDVAYAGDRVVDCDNGLQRQGIKYDPEVHDWNVAISALCKISFLAINHLP